MWKTIEEYSDYRVSDIGEIESTKRGITRLLKPMVSKKGYLRIELGKNGIAIAYSIHRLVATAFIPNPENKTQVNHIDGNKKNNHVENLEWATAKENVRHSLDVLGTKGSNTGKKGFLNHLSKPVNQIDKKTGEIIKTFGSIKEATREMNGHDTNIRCCISGKYTHAYGYKWEYAKK